MKKYPKRTVICEGYDFDPNGLSDKKKKKNATVRYEKDGKSEKLKRAILYRGIATPIAFIYSRLIKKEKIYGKEKLKGIEGGYFLFGNHTNAAADALCPGTYTYPKYADTVVNPENYSVPVIGRFIHRLGAIPTPEGLRDVKRYKEAITRSISLGRAVVIYPEGHLWQYARDLRPFGASPFLYAASLSVPSFAMTRVYKRKKSGFYTEVYIDGPFYPESGLPPSEAAAGLCEAVRGAMKERCRLSDIDIIKYIVKKEGEDE